MPVVSARGLVRTFGEGRAARRVLDGADLDVAPGEIVAVLGRSGSGKSTLLHVLGGLDRPDAGVVEVAGERVTGARERRLSALRRRHVGFVFQFFHLLPELTGEGERAARRRACAGAAPDAAARGRALVDAARARRRSRARSRTSSRAASSSGSRSPARSSTTRAAARRRADGQPRRRGGRDRAARCCASSPTRAARSCIVTHEAAAAAIADRVLRLRDGRLEPA